MDLAASDEQTPVARLAWKFAQVMQPSSDGKVNLALRDEVAAYLRQEAGLSRLVNAYHHLLPRPGPRTEKARFLFVIDQFEELFHPNNRDNADTRVIIEALIDHFRNPDPRAYVVMTMRSEHLADCAAYLNLPDAINRSFYLVRRLSNSELRSVITEPAQVMERVVQRQDPTRTASVEFQPSVVARLLADTRRIEDDPDHLPLLQHLLARLWSSALTREQRPPTGDVPATVTMADLEAAVEPWPSDRVPGWLPGDRKLSALRSSLENWAEYIYLRQRNADQRAHIDELLAKLAYKDPNNGLYFQQRVRVDDPHLLQGIAAPKYILWDLLKDGLVDTVNYLFWDDENRDHVTLKVSHEAFIRGWPRFRRVADREAERFEEFVAVLRRCALWQDGKSDDSLLLEASEIERIKLSRLLPVFAEAHKRMDWFAVLRLYREGERLVKLEHLAQPFIENSMARQQRLQDEAKAQELKFKLAEEATRKAEEDRRIAQAKHQSEMAAAEAMRRQIEAEAGARKAEADLFQARAAQDVAEAQRLQMEIEADLAKTEAERNQARADKEAANAQQLLAEAEAARANADAATAQAATERIQARADKEAAEARRSRTINWAVSLVAVVFVPVAVHAWLYFWPAITSAEQFLQSQRDIESRPRSDLSPTPHAAVEELVKLAEAADRTLKTQAGQPLLQGYLTADQLRAATLRLPFGAGFLQRLVDGASSEQLVNRQMRRLLTAAVWDGGASDRKPHKTLDGDEVECEVIRWEKAPSMTLKGRYFKGLQPELGLFVPDRKALPDERAIFSSQRNVDGKPCTGRFSFSVPESISPSFIFDADLSAMAVVANGQDTQLYDVEWNWDGRSSTRAMMARFPLRRILTDPRAAAAFKADVTALGSASVGNPARVLETRPLPGGLEVKLGKDWWALLTPEARRLPEGAAVLNEGWQKLGAPAKDSPCAALGGWLTKSSDKSVEGPADAERPKPLITVEVLAVPGDLQCVSFTRIDNSGGLGTPSAESSADSVRRPREVVSVAAYHAVAVDAARKRAGGMDRPPAPFADWRFDSQVRGAKRDWWVGMPGTDWDGWLAATDEGSTKDAVASPYSTAALKRLADGIVAASLLPKGGAGSGDRAAVQPNSKP